MPCRVTKSLLFSLLIAAASLVPAARVCAFSDPLSYSDPVDLGGGAGRWFTGSSADGYGCDVCHLGRDGADITVSGLPEAGYVPGRAYEVRLTWPADVVDIALVAEFTDEERHGVGAVALPRPETLAPGELCAPEEGGESPIALHEADGGRTLISMVDCGARLLRFQWTAPPSTAGKPWFNTGLVLSNQDTTPSGDGVTLVRRLLAPSGRSESRTIASGCNAAGSRRDVATLAVLSPIAVLLRARKRAKGRAS